MSRVNALERKTRDDHFAYLFQVPGDTTAYTNVIARCVAMNGCQDS